LLAPVCDAHFLISGFPLYFKHLHEHDESMTGSSRGKACIGAPVDVCTRMDAGFADE
jgi:hypothetical protein